MLTRWPPPPLPQGDPADLPPAPKFIEGWQLGAPDLVLRLSRPYPLPADGQRRLPEFYSSAPDP